MRKRKKKLFFAPLIGILPAFGQIVSAAYPSLRAYQPKPTRVEGADIVMQSNPVPGQAGFLGVVLIPRVPK
jgi:hypothetical protein